jgi:L-alanine-DL-glutamate epimerase-like enolase superfamily enzyme
VTDVKITIVSVPFTKPETWRFGRLWGLTNAIVEVETDAGVSGWGESPGSPLVSLVVEGLRATNPWIVGEDPREITSFLRRAARRGWHHYPYLGNTVTAAIEIALWDIVGKIHECPVHELLGGLVRTSVPFYWYLPVEDRRPETARAEAAEGVRRGFRTLYLKIGFEVAADAALARAIRDEVGADVALRVDANEAWSAFEAVEALRAFEAAGVEFVEQPIDMRDIEGLGALRARTRARIGANQTAWLPRDVLELVTRRAADVIVTDPHQLGGLATFQEIAALCELAGVPLIKHSFGDLGVTTAASLHVLGRLHEPCLAHQTHLPILEHDLLVEPLAFTHGALTVPQGPGIGVEVDREALGHYADLYERFGEFEGYGEIDAPSPIPADARRGALP